MAAVWKDRMIDTARVEAMAKILTGTPVAELVVACAGLELRLSRTPEMVAVPVTMAPDDLCTVSPGPTECPVTATRVGIFHVGRKPVAVGDRLQPGDVIGFVESMRIPNEVASPFGGMVIQVLVEDGSPVEYGQELLIVKEDSDECIPA